MYRTIHKNYTYHIQKTIKMTDKMEKEIVKNWKGDKGYFDENDNNRWKPIMEKEREKLLMRKDEIQRRGIIEGRLTIGGVYVLIKELEEINKILGETR